MHRPGHRRRQVETASHAHDSSGPGTWEVVVKSGKERTVGLSPPIVLNYSSCSHFFAHGIRASMSSHGPATAFHVEPAKVSFFFALLTSVLLTSFDQDGTRAGYDCPLLKVTSISHLPPRFLLPYPPPPSLPNVLTAGGQRCCVGSGHRLGRGQQRPPPAAGPRGGLTSPPSLMPGCGRRFGCLDLPLQRHYR